MPGIMDFILLTLLLLTHHTGLAEEDDTPKQYALKSEKLAHSLSVSNKYPEAVKSNSHFLFPNYGMLFEPVALLIATSDYYLLQLQLELPDYEELLNQITPEGLLDKGLLCKDDPGMRTNVGYIIPDNKDPHLEIGFQDNSRLSVAMCDTYHRMFRIMSTDLEVHRSELLVQHDNIKLFVHEVHRHKRGFFAVGASILSTAFKAASWFIDERRRKAMWKTIGLMRRQHYRLSHRFQDFSEEMITFASITNNQIQSLRYETSALSEDLDSLRKISFSNFKIINESMRSLRWYGIKNRYYILMTAKAMAIREQMQSYMRTSSNTFTTTLESFYELDKGKLPPALVSRTHLSRAVAHVMQSLQQTHPGYELTLKNPLDIYKQNDIAYTIENRNLLIQIPLYIRPKSSPPMTLYKVSVTEVPFITDDNNQDMKHPSYTKIQTKFDYMAADQTSFIPMTQYDLSRCNKFSDLHVCTKQMIHLHRSSKHCLSAIFWDRPIEIVLELCDFQFYYNIRPTPQILSADQWILLAHVPTPWTLNCQSNNIPAQHQSDSYCIVHRSMFCKCVLQSLELYIPSDDHNCNRSAITDIQHPLNSVVAYKLQHIFPHFKSMKIQFDAKTVYSEDVEMPLPNLNLIESSSDNDIIQDMNQIPPTDLDHVVNILSKNHEAYLTRLAKEEANDNIDGYMNDQKGLGGVVFVGSLLGILAFLVLLVLCFYTGRMKLLFTSLLASMPQPASATEILPHYCSNFFYHLVLSTSYHLLYGLLAISMYHLIRKLYHRIILFRYFIPVKGNGYCHPGKTHLYLEILSDKDKILIYIGSIQASVLNFKISKSIFLESIKIMNRKCFNILYLQWSRPYYIFQPTLAPHLNIPNCNLNEQETEQVMSSFVLPTRVVVNPFKIKRLRRMLKEPFVTRCLLLSDIYYPLTDLKVHSVNFNPTTNQILDRNQQVMNPICSTSNNPVQPLESDAQRETQLEIN